MNVNDEYTLILQIPGELVNYLCDHSYGERLFSCTPNDIFNLNFRNKTHICERYFGIQIKGFISQLQIVGVKISTY